VIHERNEGELIFHYSVRIEWPLRLRDRIIPWIPGLNSAISIDLDASIHYHHRLVLIRGCRMFLCIQSWPSWLRYLLRTEIRCLALSKAHSALRPRIHPPLTSNGQQCKMRVSPPSRRPHPHIARKANEQRGRFFPASALPPPAGAVHLLPTCCSSAHLRLVAPPLQLPLRLHPTDRGRPSDGRRRAHPTPSSAPSNDLADPSKQPPSLLLFF
jgi:hypothetical protein